jgi:hypothetical protein
MAEEEEDRNGWKVGYLYQDPEHEPGDHPIERDEVTRHHVWAPPRQASTDH